MRDPIEDMPSIQGYINWEELVRVLLEGVGQTTLFGLFAALMMSLGDSVDAWYTGPAGPTVIFVFTSIATFLRTKSLARKLMSEGTGLSGEYRTAN